ncbi:hypothetical protein M569_13907 [Genlisea aurea]|uniref:Uncharacterized protein n=1 Tax=Genlisea aurea TaxID=192259 RepID=S8C2A3_9LAMI|nr:hypothetical protein M569_13907 [Genlisea aurea]
MEWEKESEGEAMYRIDWGVLKELKIGDQVREYLERSRLLELIAAEGPINVRHLESFYDTVQLTRYHDIDDACFSFTLDDRPFLCTARRFAIESGLISEEEGNSEEFGKYETRVENNFDPHKACRRPTEAGGEWNKSRPIHKDLEEPAMRYIQFLIAYNLTGRTKNFFIPTIFELWLLDCIKSGKKVNPGTVAYQTIWASTRKSRRSLRKLGHVIIAG